MMRTILRSSSLRLLLAGMLMLLAACGTPEDDEAVGSEFDDENVQANFDAASADSIRAVLDAQVEAWNRGSIRDFMDGYARTDTLRFASGGNVWYGWDVARVRYEDTYADEGLMGTLSFSDVDIWPVSDRHAVVFGRWALARSETYADIGGLFTLVFERAEDGWVIVHDHTSARQTLASNQDTVESTP